jgi:membrane-associated protease RseP (regulator of RpoE activity)
MHSDDQRLAKKRIPTNSMQDLAVDGNVEQLTAALRGLFNASQVKTFTQPVRGVEFTGNLVSDADSTFSLLRERFESLGYTPYLEQDGQAQVLRAFEGVARPKPLNAWVNLALLLLTIASTVLTGALNEGINPLTDPAGLLRGIPFAFTVMVILGTHEMGHYIVGRKYKADVSLPYFIPLPGFLFGTMGAVIVQRSPFQDRKSLFDVAIAGPLAGLIVAIPLLIIGLAASPVQPIQPGGLFEGNSLFYLGLKYLIFHRLLPANGLDVYLTPVAFAAWFGLLVTFLNLIPIGQLDGGHVLYALLGRRAWPIATFLSQLLLVVGGLGIVGEIFNIPVLAQNFWSGWFIWGILTTWMRPQHPPPLNDISPLGPVRTALGIFAIVLFVLLFARIPLSMTPILY